MKIVIAVALLGAVLFACGAGEPESESAPAPAQTGPLLEPCMSAPNDPPAPAWDGHTICHLPPGNPANAHTLSVGSPAVPAHLAHGDTLGPCGSGGGGGGGGGPGECLPIGAACTNLECCAGLGCVKPDFTPCAGDATAGCSCVVLLN